MKFYSQMDVGGDNNIGFYSVATDKYIISGKIGKRKAMMKKTLGIGVGECMIMGLNLVKLFITGNSSFLFIPCFLFENDKQGIREAAGKKCSIVELDTEKALGNMMLLNDNGIVISPMIRGLQKTIEKESGMKCEISTIASFGIIGSAGVATNRGCLLHPKVRQSELEKIEKTLAVSADIGTVSFGSPYPGSGIVANSKGFVASRSTSGPELGRIAEALGFVES